MARRIELKTVPISSTGGLGNGGAPPQIFSYAQMCKALLRFGPPGGLNFEEVVRSVAALVPFDEAAAAGADHVVLSDEHWNTLKDKLTIFPFAVADPEIVAFGLMIRDAPEIGTTT